jgi:diaminopimelate epimerase
MQSLGNDFVVIDAVRQKIKFTAEQIKKLADRHYGVGCDQVLLLEAAHSGDTDFFYRIFNSDGSEAEQCGNGARCLAKFIHDQGLSKKNVIKVGTISRVMELHLDAGGSISVNMGSPTLVPQEIPFLVAEQKLYYQLDLPTDLVLNTSESRNITIGAVALGNPHAVLKVDSVTSAPALKCGEWLEKHALFPHGVNIEFMEIINPATIKLRIYERGVGETLACGSGACASVIIGHLWGLLQSKVTVQMLGGSLEVRWSGELKDPVWLCGSAVKVFSGEWKVE